MNTETPQLISDLADMTGGTIHECVNDLGDGSGFATMSFPLPEDHWLYTTDKYGFTPNPEYRLLVGGHYKTRRYLEDQMLPGVQHGIKAATSNGRLEDFDPDALAKNVLIANFGVYTETGLSGSEGNYKPDPEEPGSLQDVLLTALSLAVSEGLIPSEAVQQSISPAGLKAAQDVYEANEARKQAEYEDLCRRKGWGTSADQVAGGYLSEGDLVIVDAPTPEKDHE